MSDVLKGHVPALDGLRALAVGAVLCVHAGVPGFDSGWLGVDLFFAISGFLITTLMLKEFDSKGAISLRFFWGRRFLRLMPAYLVYVIVFTLMIWLWSGSVLSTYGVWTPQLYTLSLYGYFVNFVPKGGVSNLQEYTGHLWSLAVEEQYYLFWPVILCFFVRSRFLLPIVWGGVFLVFMVFMFYSNDFERTNMLYARGLPLFFASAVAVTIWHPSKGRDWIVMLAKAKFLPIGTVLLTSLAFVSASAGWLSVHSVRYSFLPALSFGYTLLVVRFSCSDCDVYQWLEHKWLVHIGKVSYGIYLYHVFVREGVWRFSDPLVLDLPAYQAYGIRLALYFIFSLMLALVSYRFLEMPFLRMKRRFRKSIK